MNVSVKTAWGISLLAVVFFYAGSVGAEKATISLGGEAPPSTVSGEVLPSYCVRENNGWYRCEVSGYVSAVRLSQANPDIAGSVQPRLLKIAISNQPAVWLDSHDFASNATITDCLNITNQARTLSKEIKITAYFSSAPKSTDANEGSLWVLLSPYLALPPPPGAHDSVKNLSCEMSTVD